MNTIPAIGYDAGGIDEDVARLKFHVSRFRFYVLEYGRSYLFGRCRRYDITRFLDYENEKTQR